MPNNEAYDSRNLYSCFWVYIDARKIDLKPEKKKKSGGQSFATLDGLLAQHPSFSGFNPYFSKNQMTSPDQWHITVMEQHRPVNQSLPEQTLSSAKQIQDITRDMKLIFSGYDQFFSLGGRGLATYDGLRRCYLGM